MKRPSVAVTVAEPLVRDPDLAVTVMAPGPVACTTAKDTPRKALRVSPRKVSWILFQLSTATILPGPVIVYVTGAEELVTTFPAASAIAALMYETSFRSVNRVA